MIILFPEFIDARIPRHEADVEQIRSFHRVVVSRFHMRAEPFPVEQSVGGTRGYQEKAAIVVEIQQRIEQEIPSNFVQRWWEDGEGFRAGKSGKIIVQKFSISYLLHDKSYLSRANIFHLFSFCFSLWVSFTWKKIKRLGTDSKKVIKKS